MQRKKSGAIIIGLLALALAVGLGTTKTAWAESDLEIGGGDAKARLDFLISIPTILYLQVGSTGNIIDVIRFKLDDIPGTGEIEGKSSGANPTPVRAAGFVPPGQTMTLTADSSIPLDDGSGNQIPFSKIRWAANGDFSPGTFRGIAGQVLDKFKGSGDRNGDYTFYYANDEYYPAGDYKGRVTYTLSSP